MFDDGVKVEFDYYVLNVMLNFYDGEGCICFDVDCKVVWQYFLQYVNQNMVFFYNFDEKLCYLIDEGYYEFEVLDQYFKNFQCVIWDVVYEWKFCFLIFLGVFKYYISYMLKIWDGQCYLECYEDCVVMVLLVLVCGDEVLVMSFMQEILFGCFQFVMLIFLNVGKKLWGELIFCFLLWLEDNMEFIGCLINLVL